MESNFANAVYDEIARRGITALVEAGRIEADESTDWDILIPACACLAPLCDCTEVDFIHCSQCKTAGVFRNGSIPD